MMFCDVTLAAIAIGGAALNIAVLTMVRACCGRGASPVDGDGQAVRQPVNGLQSIEVLKSTGTERLLRQVGRPRPGAQLRAETDLPAGHQPGAALRVEPDRRGGSRRRPCRWSRRAQRRRAGRLPGACYGFSGPIAQMVGTASKVNRPRPTSPARRRIAVPARLALFRDAGASRDLRRRPPVARQRPSYNPLEPPLIEDIVRCRARAMGRVGRRFGRRQVDPGQDHHRPLCRAALRSHRRTARRMGPRPAGPHRVVGRQDISLFQGTLRTTLTLWTDGDPSHPARRRATPTWATSSSIAGASTAQSGRRAQPRGGQRQRVEIARARSCQAFGAGARRGDQRPRYSERRQDPERGAPARHDLRADCASRA